MYFGSQEYLDRTLEFGYNLSKALNPLADEVTHFTFADNLVRQAKKRQDRFYGRTSKYMPHQGAKEIARRKAKMEGI